MPDPLVRFKVNSKLYVSDVMRSFNNDIGSARRQFLMDFHRMSVCVEGEPCGQLTDVPAEFWHMSTQASLGMPLCVAQHVFPWTLIDNVPHARMAVDIWNTTLLINKRLSACDPQTMERQCVIVVSIIMDSASSFTRIKFARTEK